LIVGKAQQMIELGRRVRQAVSFPRKTPT